ncbi:hypothetical protein HB911_16845 [Listeria booriae]|uniref:Uncharacterized protein n=1 Tax=Listeria booriae TaxID=1552123 RepID=A0A7X0YPV6_9LIST|nr:hypothetical protein [Listeria booriae]MBC1560386.1 hypothetical protein [Listeria booriae]MBC1563733.1 hypothetical protein [Listeria booriae]MBC2118354.1 hypothetical protein [Listeria booriae]MBC2208413.1 hypothetical protein [Listeria booriae]MBC2245696.1 hypothetical protein [Listeria booriae]
MEDIFSNIGDWFGSAVVIIGIIVGILSYFKKAEPEEEAKKKASQPKAPQQRAKHQQTKKKPVKKAQPTAYKDTVIKDAMTNTSHDPYHDVRHSHHEHTAARKRVRGKMQEAIIMKEILDKPVALRKNQ